MSGFNAKTCPITAAFVLAMREQFGDDEVKVIALSENGVEYPAPQQSADQTES